MQFSVQLEKTQFNQKRMTWPSEFSRWVNLIYFTIWNLNFRRNKSSLETKKIRTDKNHFVQTIEYVYYIYAVCRANLAKAMFGSGNYWVIDSHKTHKRKNFVFRFASKGLILGLHTFVVLFKPHAWSNYGKN